MSPEQKAANRRVIDAAKQIEKVVQYGGNAAHAHEQYRRARVALWQARRVDWDRVDAA